MAPGINLSLLANEIEASNHPTLPQKVVKVTPTSSSKGTTVLHPSRITTEFDLLRFEGAAFGQLDVTSAEEAQTDEPNGQPSTSSLLISSPYNNPGHYLDLQDLDISNLIFSKALTALKPVREDYATAQYTESLDFPTVLHLVKNFSNDEKFQWKETSFYVVIFRSQLKEQTDNDLLYKLDYESHREACESGGLLKYWFGKPNAERRNLATCFWRSREDARLGGLGPWHKKARAAGRELYQSIVFSVHRLTILDDAVDFKFEDWTD